MMTPDEIRARTGRAVRAAAAAGRELGLRADDPGVLHDAFSLVVHLAPAPVAVRVPLVLPPALAGAALALVPPARGEWLPAQLATWRELPFAGGLA